MTGADRITQERIRQIEQERFGAEHDSQYTDGSLLQAADAYLTSAFCQVAYGTLSPDNTEIIKTVHWPGSWSTEWFKPSTDPIRNLEKAGALIAAEIDRFQRLTVRLDKGTGDTQVSTQE